MGDPFSAEYKFATVAAIKHMINRSGILDTQFSGHDTQSAQSIPPVNAICAYVGLTRLRCNKKLRSRPANLLLLPKQQLKSPSFFDLLIARMSNQEKKNWIESVIANRVRSGKARIRIGDDYI